LLVVFSLALLAGCQRYSLGDDIQFELNFSIIGPEPQGTLHLPYVEGTKVAISVFGADSSDASHFTITSDDPAVLSVDSLDRTSATASCTARASGSTTLHVLKDGSEVFAESVDVAIPTHAVVSPSGPLFVGDPTPFDANGTTEVLTFGTATYEVQYFNGDTRLFGNGVLTANADAGMDASPEETFLLQKNEWIQVTPLTFGMHAIQLLANGQPLATLHVNAVDQSAIQSVQVESMDTSGHSNGDQLVVLAQSFDADDHPIFGVTYDWNLAGEEQTGEGDMFRFPLDDGQSNVVTATFNGLTASTTIEAKADTGFVDSSNNIGCRASSRSPAEGASMLAAVALALALGVRRRRA
jgi:hypothetical protein